VLNDGQSLPEAVDRALVGTYPAKVHAGGGFVWDAVLEYRVWVPGEVDDSYRAFATYPEALKYSESTPSAEEPLALVLQDEYIDESEPGQYVHVKARRLTEWPVEFLRRPKRTSSTIPNFLSPDAPPNRLDILRGLAG
jgi:hypothetical protein